jgi:hypothetical protein
MRRRAFFGQTGGMIAAVPVAIINAGSRGGDVIICGDAIKNRTEDDQMERK